MSTITLSTIADFTAAVGAPRVAAIEYPLGQPLGKPGDSQGQKAVLSAALKALEEIQEPGEVVDLPFEWPEPPRKVRSHPRKPPPIVKLIKRRPWLLARFISGAIPESN